MPRHVVEDDALTWVVLRFQLTLLLLSPASISNQLGLTPDGKMFCSFHTMLEVMVALYIMLLCFVHQNPNRFQQEINRMNYHSHSKDLNSFMDNYDRMAFLLVDHCICYLPCN